MRPLRSLAGLLVLGAACSQTGTPNAPAVGEAGVDASTPAAPDATADAVGDAPALDATSDAVGPDVATDSPPAACNAKALFGPPVEVAGTDLDTAAEEGGPWLTADERTIYFSTRRLYPDSGANPLPSGLFVAHRSSATAAFDAPTPLITLDPPNAWDFDPATLTELTLYFSSTWPGGQGGLDLWVASRTSVANDFDPPVDLPAPINSTYDDHTPALTADGSELWFASNRPGGVGGYDIYWSRKSGSSFGAPQLVPAVSSPADEYTPVLSADKLVIFFSSSRTDGAVLGDQDIWTASRARVTDPFSNAQPVTEVNSPQADYAGWVSPDGCRLYMSSRRPGPGDASTSEDIYVATRGQ